MKRRTFLDRSLKAGLLFGLGGFSAVTKSCRTAYDFDLIIQKGSILDGTGKPRFTADIGLKGPRVTAIGNLSARSAYRTITADGLFVSPGFIDVHSHSERKLLINPNAESKIRQGVTTEICGQDGGSFPPDEFPTILSKYMESGIAVNAGFMVGQGTIREMVVGLNDRPATSEEITKMRMLAKTALENGALGISSGLEYTPGGYATTEEIGKLCEAMSGTSRVYATHMRNEDDRLLEAVREAIDIARTAGVRLHISHLKCQGKRNWPKLDEVFEVIRHAETAGQTVTFDRYPYVAYSTGLSNLMPLWCREGGTNSFISRLQDNDILARIKKATLDKINLLGSWNSVMITSVNLEKNKRYQGKTIRQIVEATQMEPFDFVKNLIVEEKNQVSMVGFGMSEKNTERILAHPACMPASDGSALADYGELSKGNPHPRSYGTFPRFLGKYVRENKIVSWEEAIRKITSLPAQRFGLTNRGQIKENSMADLVIFDPETILDQATFANPHQYPKGIQIVIVNGSVVIEEMEHTNALQGMILRAG